MSFKKGQILAMTIFMLLVILGSTVVLLMPIQQQLIKTRKLLYSFQALTFAETGLEIGNFKILKEFVSPTETFPYQGSLCEHKINKYQSFIAKSGWVPGNSCDLYEENDSDYITQVYSTEMTKPAQEFVYSFFISNISTGEYKGIKRLLDFDFLP